MNRIIKKFINRYQEILLPAVLLIASAALAFLGILPAVSKILDLWETVGKTRDSVNLLSGKVAFLSSQDEFSLRQKLMTIVSAIPQDKSFPSILGLIDGLSAETGVTLVSVSLSGGQLSTASAKLQTTQEKVIGASLLPFTVSIAGPTNGILDFIARATKVRRLIRFQNFDVSLVASGTGTLRANFQAFYTPLPKTAAVAEQILPQLTAEDNATLDKLTSYAWVSRETAAQQSTSKGKANPFSP